MQAYLKRRLIAGHKPSPRVINWASVESNAKKDIHKTNANNNNSNKYMSICKKSSGILKLFSSKITINF